MHCLPSAMDPLQCKILFFRALQHQQKVRAHICHGYHGLYLWRKNCHVEKFLISVKILNKLWSFIEIYAVFVLNLYGEKSVWRQNDKYEVCQKVADGTEA